MSNAIDWFAAQSFHNADERPAARTSKVAPPTVAQFCERAVILAAARVEELSAEFRAATLAGMPTEGLQVACSAARMAHYAALIVHFETVSK